MTPQEALAVVQREHKHGTGSIPRGAFDKALAVLRAVVVERDSLLADKNDEDATWK